MDQQSVVPKSSEKKLGGMLGSLAGRANGSGMPKREEGQGGSAVPDSVARHLGG